MTSNSSTIHDAKGLINTYYSDCLAAFLAGSNAKGQQTSTSDLDIVIINKDGRDFRKSFIAKGWPVELFVLSLNTYSLYFDLERQTGLPLYTRMLAESIILQDTNRLAIKIQQKAKSILEQGPERLLSHQILDKRYIITDLPDDLRGSDGRNEDLFIVSSLVHELPEFILRVNNKWTGDGKWILRSLHEYNPIIADKLCSSLVSFYQHGKKETLLTLTENILKEYGGELFDGHTSTTLL